MTGKQFSYEDDQGEGVVWYKGEPIWITATKQGMIQYNMFLYNHILICIPLDLN